MSSTSSFGPKIFACFPQYKIHHLSSMRLLTVNEKSEAALKPRKILQNITQELEDKDLN